MKLYFIPPVLLLLIHNVSVVLSSDGDRSVFYQNCVKNCVTANCTGDGSTFTKKAASQQDVWCRILRWSCKEECRYQCMWRTVLAFEERGYPVPKFHGKWPFKRLFGIQEPASTFCSLLNLLAHLHMYFKIRRDKRFSVKETPMLLFWYIFIAVCVNAWVWSMKFHARDTPLTEFMDYACALSMVMALFVAAVVRVGHKHKKLTTLVLLLPLLYFVEHTRYLYTGRIDYEYNMMVNVFCGLAGSLLWLGWSLAHWRRTGSRYVWRMVLFNKLSGAALLLELFDFPPFAHAWDAHAFWHLSTAPLPLLFYRFVIDDLEYLQTEKQSEKASLKLA